MQRERRKKPGVMIYFELRPALEMLSVEQKAALLDAIMDYGEKDIAPSFDGVLAMAWHFVKQHIDRDAKNYDLKCRKASYSNYVKLCKEQGIVYVSFDEWDEAK